MAATSARHTNVGRGRGSREGGRGTLRMGFAYRRRRRGQMRRWARSRLCCHDRISAPARRRGRRRGGGGGEPGDVPPTCMQTGGAVTCKNFGELELCTAMPLPVLTFLSGKYCVTLLSMMCAGSWCPNMMTIKTMHEMWIITSSGTFAFSSGSGSDWLGGSCRSYHAMHTCV